MPHLPLGLISTNSYNKIGFCWSKSRAPRWHPTVNAILLSPWPHRNRWGENAERSSSRSCCPDPHELWSSKGKMKRQQFASKASNCHLALRKLLFNHSHVGFETAPKFLFCLEELDSFRSYYLPSLCFLKLKFSLSEIRQLIDTSYAQAR